MAVTADQYRRREHEAEQLARWALIEFNNLLHSVTKRIDEDQKLSRA
jgi:hypothetical protein